MQSIIKKNYPIRREVVSREEARTRIEAQGEPYKLELLDVRRPPFSSFPSPNPLA
jgi:threonyl-tRNA synthetase